MHGRAELNQQGNVRRRGINKDAVTGLHPNIGISWPSSFTFSPITLPILPVFLLRRRSQISATEAASASNGRISRNTRTGWRLVAFLSSRK